MPPIYIPVVLILSSELLITYCTVGITIGQGKQKVIMALQLGFSN